MKYMVSMEEINFGGVVVEASSAEEAREKAEQEYENGNVFWKTQAWKSPQYSVRKIEVTHDER